MSRQTVLVLVLVAVLVVGSGVVCAWAQGRVYLDTGTYHIGNGQFSGSTDQEIVAQNAVVGPKWSIAFAADRPIQCSIQIDMLYGVGGNMPDDAESGVVTIGDMQLGEIRPRDNRRPWTSALCGLGVVMPSQTVTIHSSKWQGDFDDFVFRGVLVAYTPADARVSVIGEGQVLQEGEEYTGTGYVGPSQGVRIDALPHGGPFSGARPGRSCAWATTWCSRARTAEPVW